MLCLARKIDEAIYVGDHRVVVLKIKGSKVYLGIDAPKDVPVDREEVRQAKQREAAAAAVL